MHAKTYWCDSCTNRWSSHCRYVVHSGIYIRHLISKVHLQLLMCCWQPDELNTVKNRFLIFETKSKIFKAYLVNVKLFYFYRAFFAPSNFTHSVLPFACRWEKNIRLRLTRRCVLKQNLVIIWLHTFNTTHTLFIGAVITRWPHKRRSDIFQLRVVTKLMKVNY